jgi:hypothetical protein
MDPAERSKLEAELDRAFDLLRRWWDIYGGEAALRSGLFSPRTSASVTLTL